MARNAGQGYTLTFKSRLCQYGSHSLAAASMHSFTAAARSGRILRIISSAFGEPAVKFSHASKSVAAGEDDPGRKMDTLDAENICQEVSI